MQRLTKKDILPYERKRLPKLIVPFTEIDRKTKLEENSEDMMTLLFSNTENIERSDANNYVIIRISSEIV